MDRAKDIADFKAVSMNALHSSMEITDELYSNLNDGEVQSRIGSLGKGNPASDDNQKAIKVLKGLLSRLEKQNKS